jgi:hypothetical protein
MQTAKAKGVVLVSAMIGLTLAACTDAAAPSGTKISTTATSTTDVVHQSGAHADQGYIGGWLDGETVALRYTRLYFCEEPPSSAAASNCEVGAPPEVTPRSGPIPLIYAIAAAGIKPDPGTLHCPGGTVCLNHPSTLDLSRIGGPPSALAVSHSHIITGRQGGWHRTVNIIVRDLAVWNEIAAAKTLTRVRELQADPLVGGANRISQDNLTNIFFFLEVQQR